MNTLFNYKITAKITESPLNIVIEKFRYYDETQDNKKNICSSFYKIPIISEL